MFTCETCGEAIDVNELHSIQIIVRDEAEKLVLDTTIFVHKVCLQNTEINILKEVKC